MALAFHILVLLSIPVATVALLGLSRKAKLTRGQMVGSIVVSLLACLVVYGLSMHNCDRGQPFQQILIPGLCLAAGWALTSSRRIRIMLSGSIIILMTVLSFHYLFLSHRPDLVGNPESRMLQDGCQARFAWHTVVTGLYEVNPPEQYN